MEEGESLEAQLCSVTMRGSHLVEEKNGSRGGYTHVGSKAVHFYRTQPIMTPKVKGKFPLQNEGHQQYKSPGNAIIARLAETRSSSFLGRGQLIQGRTLLKFQ